VHADLRDAQDAVDRADVSFDGSLEPILARGNLARLQRTS
jgi:hypothetical protein